jgi:hypothetical protein
VEHGVEFIVVGGVGAVLQGAPITTFDLDIVHSRTPANLNRLKKALLALDAHYRDFTGRVLRPKAADLDSAGHHLLLTHSGPLDLLGTIGTSAGYDELISHSTEMESAGMRLWVLDLETLIRLKEESTQAKDRAMIPVLRQTLLEKKSRGE